MGSKKTNFKPNLIFNKYIISALFFITWLCFFDQHNVVNQFKLRNTVHKLEKEKSSYLSKLEHAVKERDELEKNKERYAREKYFMHKENEDVFIIDRN